jgi:hypothetical protein
MTLDLGFAYAQARIQARFAGLPEEGEWQRLAPCRTLASFLEDARSGSLRGWLKGFSSQSDVHDLEAGLRSLYRETLDEVARWVPAPWRPALSWTRWLMHLPLLAHLRAGGEVPEWVEREPDLRVLLAEDGTLDPKRLAGAGIDFLFRAEPELTDAWIEQWRRRWPDCSREATCTLDSLIALFVEHAETFRRISPAAAWSLRGELRERLRLRLHGRVLQSEVPFIYLALMALDLERLRAALVSRVLFPTQNALGWSATDGRSAA